MAPARGGGLRVLVVDDEADLLLLYRVWLQREGHQVFEAGTGREALEAARGGEIELVLLDMMLPEVDGFSVLDELASDPRTERVPVVIVSARIAADDQLRGLEAGAVAYLTKPFPIERLTTLVNSIGAMDAEERQQLRADTMVRLGPGGNGNSVTNAVN